MIYVGVVVVILVAFGLYYFIRQATKYKRLYIDAIASLFLENKMKEEEIDWRNRIQIKMEKRDEILSKINDFAYSNDDLNNIRSGLLPSLKEDSD